MRLSFSMPSVEIGDEHLEIERLVALASDLQAYQAGQTPTPEMLSDKPRIHRWFIQRIGEEFRFYGEVTYPGATHWVHDATGIARALSQKGKWLRCDRQLWRLGSPMPLHELAQQ